MRQKAKAKAEEILQKVSKGDDFSVLARTLSDDAESAPKGGDLGYITEGKTNSPEFEKAIFALKSGETTGVVETSFGFHIARVDERKDARTATFEEAREYMTGVLKEEVKARKSAEFFEKIAKESALEVVGEQAPPAK